MQGSYQHKEQEEIDKSKNKDANDVNVTNGDESDKVNSQDNLRDWGWWWSRDYLPKNSWKPQKERKWRQKQNKWKNVAVQMQQFKFVST